MAASRAILVAGAGIGGLSAALALAAHGFHVVVLEQADRLEETGAGIQLSPNATRVLRRLGLMDAVAPHVVAPEAVCVRAAHTGKPIVRVPLGSHAENRYGAPYWTIHRGDLQQVLAAAVLAHPAITLKLGVRVVDVARHPAGVTVATSRGGDPTDERGAALIGADGLWSAVRTCLVGANPPRFRGRIAWRALVDAEALPAALQGPIVSLWLGARAHLVHYPVRGGRAVNIVVVTQQSHEREGWSVAATGEDMLAQWPAGTFADRALSLLSLPERWLTWSLYDRPKLRRWGSGPVTLLGDAAHPMLPFLAQGGAMAIEDASVLAARLAASADDPPAAFRRYEADRLRRTARAQADARRNARIYHLAGVAGAARDGAMRLIGGERLLARHDWLYGWT